MPAAFLFTGTGKTPAPDCRYGNEVRAKTARKNSAPYFAEFAIKLLLSVGEVNIESEEDRLPQKQSKRRRRNKAFK